jgi:hypothetical protein
MVTLLNQKPISRSQYNSIEELKCEIKEMEKISEILTSKVNNSSEIIDEQCEIVKNQLEIRTESVIQNIEQSKEICFLKVDEYAKKCKEAINKDNMNKVIKKNLEESNKYANLLKGQILDEDEVIEMVKDVADRKNNLKELIKNFDCFLFSEAKLKFEESQNDEIDFDLIGKLVYEPMNSFNLDVKSTATIKMKRVLSLDNNVKNVLVLENGSTLILFCDPGVHLYDNNLRQVILPYSIARYFYYVSSCNRMKSDLIISYKKSANSSDYKPSDDETLDDTDDESSDDTNHEDDIDHEGGSDHDDDSEEMYAFGRTSLMYRNTGLEDTDSDSSSDYVRRYRLAILDQNFVKKKMIKTTKCYEFLCGNSVNIIGLESDYDLDIYDSNLKILRKIVFQTE